MIFLLAAISNILQPQSFFSVLKGYPFLPTSFIQITALLIINIEAIIALMLIIPERRLLGAKIAFVTLLIFTVIQGNNLITKNKSDCGCFIGIYERNTNLFTILENLFLMFLCIILLFNHFKTRDTNKTYY